MQLRANSDRALTIQSGSQHNGVKNLDPPYVYNVKAGDRLGLEAAIKQAVANPIDS